MRAPRRFQTARLMLIAPGPADAPAIFERYAGDPEVTRYVSWPRHRSLAETRAFLAYSATEWACWPGGPYLIRSRADGRLLGGTGLAFDRPGVAMTGYVLAKDAWGMGYATEALRAMVYLGQRLGLATLYALCHPAHQSSRRVLEKGGFVHVPWSGRAEFPNLEPGVVQQVLRYEVTPAPC